MNRKLDWRWLVVTGSALASAACTQASEPPEQVGSTAEPVIVGPDNLQYVNAYDGSRGVSKAYVAAHKRPVAAISHLSDENIATCSGTLIGTNLFLTAAHCFQLLGYVPEEWTVFFNYEHATTETSPLLPIQSFAVTEVLEHADDYNALEYAILRLDGDPGATFHWTDLRETPAAVGELVSVIGHPASRPKQVDAGHLHTAGADTIGYDVDTLARSSGSGVLDAAGKLLAVHTTGHDAPAFNHGARISSILAVSPLLRDIASGSSFTRDLDFCAAPDSQLFSGDFDADQRDDLLCRSGDSVSIAYANASGQFTGAGFMGNLGFCNQAGAKLYAGDFNGDGRDDLLCRDPSGHTAVALTNASGQVQGVTWSATLAWCNQAGARLLVGDINADGRDDLVCRDGTGYTSGAFASAAGQFPPGSWSTTVNWCKQASATQVLGDVNKDGRKDLICHDPTGYTSWMLATSGGRYSSSSFGQVIDFCKSAAASLYARDLNGDRRADLLCREPSGVWSVSLANGSGKFTGTTRSAASPWCAGAQHVVAGGFNGDARGDLACVESSGALRIANAREDGAF